MMKYVIASICWMSALICSGVSKHAFALSPEEVMGTCKLISSVREDVKTGKTANNLGEHPNRILVLTSENRFVLIETAAGRQASKTAEGLAALQKSMPAYSGKFT